MKELIPLNQNNSNAPVSAKDLYDFLEIKTAFSNWIKRMFDYGFEEGKDFTPFLAESSGGRPLADYALTLDCAKEISMIQRSEKGKQARQYFLECEKLAKDIKSVNPATLSRMDILQIAMEAEKENQHLRQVVEVQEKKLETKSALESFGEHLSNEDIYVLTPTVIGARLGLSANALNRKLLALGVIKRAINDYEMTSKYLNTRYGKRVVVKELAEKSIEALRWSRLGEAFIVNKIQGLDKSRYKTQIIPLSSNISVIN